jgi:hypothetical protein
MGKNVLIPLNLLEEIVELLGYWDVSGYDRVICAGYAGILTELNTKMKKLELREAYTRIIQAGDEDDRHEARIEYLWQRRQINNVGDYDV